MRADRRAPAPSPAVPAEDRQAIVLGEFRDDLTHWIESDRGTALRVMRMVEEILRDPFVEIGKPEALRHDQHGRWSRRITDRDRLLYLVRGAAIYFLAARWHYQRR
ncbi:Txe/YoeB family addiction module toxin [Longimicrobium sp.]|uniref:Txe/YoeB family addiction module toxin n=1 Tax=Longimicrobium sp. TaxID=2029185 RepID=UPI002E2F886A|nr:Txe/YoeB family addiction module toxin [Longimicrobium sp.]HEX6040220.1 Txe/YoeB family addiction module toxin [Longimicrobium sp.]